MNPQPSLEARAPGVVRFYSFLPRAQGLSEDVLAGLALPQKSIPPKYFYDEQGCRLFEAICELPEYYLTRTEMAILHGNIAEIAQFVGPEAQLIEFGSGVQAKTRILIQALQTQLYVPIDIAIDTLRASSSELARRFPFLNIVGICADHTRPIALPEFVGVPIRRKTVFFPGSTIGNFTPAEALVFLRQARKMAGAGGVLLIGVDLKKDKATLDAAYADGRGVTEQFNLNLLHRINRELAADFQVKRFRHKAFYDPILGRVEMHLESQYSQFVHVAGRRFDFAPGETIHTEISCKYSIAEFQELGKRAGFTPEKVWTDSEQLFSVHGMVAS
ncbi:MAG: L-histidine N(alpha)-methyltransferase [Betaproteobacteria bacterium]|nr:MAG: L-histidine N(alpha)-methyltransferase [Betaproteobacteria bacterium]TMH92078.1 MAG: L-histidine N(alpha)-methyltransferase [Betaproteobacteria bacterium]